MANKTYLLTSPMFTGHVSFTFSEDGMLLKYDTTEAVMDAAQRDWLTTRLPGTLIGLKEVLKSSKNSTLTLQRTVGWTFEMFWFAPGGDKPRPRWPRNSSKKKATRKWNQMSQSERDKAGNHIETYLRNIPPGIAMMYAETYLNAELWNN